MLKKILGVIRKLLNLAHEEGWVDKDERPDASDKKRKQKYH